HAAGTSGDHLGVAGGPRIIRSVTRATRAAVDDSTTATARGGTGFMAAVTCAASARTVEISGAAGARTGHSTENEQSKPVQPIPSHRPSHARHRRRTDSRGQGN